jgi:hypothetical protein
MVAPETKLDAEIKEHRFSTSSYADGGLNLSSVATFYQADLDKVQRKLNGVHVQMYVPFSMFCTHLLRAPRD